MPFPMPMPGQRPTPEQIQEIQRRIAEDAQKAGMSVPQFVEHIKRQAMEQQMRMRAAQQAAGQQPGGPGGPGGPPGQPMQVMQQQGGHDHPHPHPHQHGHPPGGAASQGRAQPITPGPPNPKALAVAKFLRNQDLKPRTSILNGERKDMFKGRLSPDKLVAEPWIIHFKVTTDTRVQQSSERCVLYNHQPTKRLARRTHCCRKLPIEPR